MTLTDLFTNIANAIRTKDGTTEPIVANDFPTRILEIPSGGTSDNFATGTFTVAEDVRITWSQYSSSYYAIPHGLETTPNVCAVWADYSTVNPDTGYFLTSDFVQAVYVESAFEKRTYTRAYNGTNGVVKDTGYANIIEPDSSNIKIGVGTGTYLRAGYTYRWMAGRIL